MRFGINSFLFVSPFTTESTKLFKKFKTIGFDSVEIPIEDPSHIDPAKVKAAADKAGLTIGSICACMGPGRDFRGSAADQKTAMDYCKKLVDQAVELGCPRIIGPIYSVVGLIGAHDDSAKKKHFDSVVKNLKVLAKYAQSKGIELDIEPLNRFETDFLNTVDQGLKLVKAVGAPNVKLHLDTFHMNIEEKNQPAAIRKAGKLLGHFHACGTDRGTPGGDSLNWAEVVKALKDVGYDNEVVIESFTTEVKVIARAAAIWRKIEPKSDDIAVKGLANLKQLFGKSGQAKSASGNGKSTAALKRKAAPAKAAPAKATPAKAKAAKPTAKAAKKPARA
ncbi:sugar phosphate isomerase/epimerase family protein [Verrucomicrobiota bacterium sgz303538]